MTIGTPVSLGIFSQTSGTSATPTIVTLADINIGDLVVVSTAGASSDDANSVSDGSANSYTAGTTYLPGTTALRFFWCIATAFVPAGSNLVVTFSAALGNKYIAASKTSGILSPTASALDQAGSGANGASALPSITTGTLAQASELIIVATYVITGSADAWTEDAGFTTLNTSPISASSVLRVAYKITAATPAVTYAPTNGTVGSPVSRTWAANYVAFKDAGVAPASNDDDILLLGVG